MTPALINSSTAAGPNSGAIRLSCVLASVAALISFDARAALRLSSSFPYESKKLITFGLVKAASSFSGLPIILISA